MRRFLTLAFGPVPVWCTILVAGASPPFGWIGSMGDTASRVVGDERGAAARPRSRAGRATFGRLLFSA